MNALIKFIFGKYKAEDLVFHFLSIVMLVISVIYNGTITMDTVYGQFNYYASSLLCLGYFFLTMLSGMKLSKLIDFDTY